MACRSQCPTTTYGASHLGASGGAVLGRSPVRCESGVAVTSRRYVRRLRTVVRRYGAPWFSPVAAWLRREPLILLYHRVEPAPYETGIHAVTPETFDHHMALLQRSYEIIHVDELYARYAAAKEVRGLAAVTFDDGHRSVLDHALPILMRRHIPATSFLIGGLLRGGSYWRHTIHQVRNAGLSALFTTFLRNPAVRAEYLIQDTKDPRRIASDEIAEACVRFAYEHALSSSRADYPTADIYRSLDTRGLLRFGSHTRHHYMLSSVPDHVVELEISGGREDLLGSGLLTSSLLAIPFGGDHTFRESTYRLAISSGHTGILQSHGTRTTRALPLAGPQRLYRFMPSSRDRLIAL
ncbi:MAG: polysaccharide deacetylase family protein [Actinomycetota bacterium]